MYSGITKMSNLDRPGQKSSPDKFRRSNRSGGKPAASGGPRGCAGEWARPLGRAAVWRKTQKVGKVNDVVSTITGDSLILFRKKFHFPNSLVVKVPENLLVLVSLLRNF
ncbi:hypothetical protein IEQ34_001186 [Dendrobium chrysotoxum]|uniref:Uncharacterized protein n=1 Tax=Dendrobium chrysotoxum TaxID=161865 RepID=A0AAV7HPU2_DENCH|nr:hypothetical protein IEQ34_001186 [Dendrobium chrysotoxum]